MKHLYNKCIKLAPACQQVNYKSHNHISKQEKCHKSLHKFTVINNLICHLTVFFSSRTIMPFNSKCYIVSQLRKKKILHFPPNILELMDNFFACDMISILLADSHKYNNFVFQPYFTDNKLTTFFTCMYGWKYETR